MALRYHLHDFWDEHDGWLSCEALAGWLSNRFGVDMTTDDMEEILHCFNPAQRPRFQATMWQGQMWLRSAPRA